MSQLNSIVFVGFSIAGKTNQKSKKKPFKVPSKFNFRSYKIIHETLGGSFTNRKNVYI
jgi:hypothetical protein